MHLIRRIGRREEGKPPPKLISRPFGVLDLPEGGRSRSSAKFDKRITKVSFPLGSPLAWVSFKCIISACVRAQLWNYCELHVVDLDEGFILITSIPIIMSI